MLEHVDINDVTAHGTDRARHETQRPRLISQRDLESKTWHGHQARAPVLRGGVRRVNAVLREAPKPEPTSSTAPPSERDPNDTDPKEAPCHSS
jgi:hypothetical protein